MSYDLYLASPQLSREAFTHYFEGRPRYQGPGAYANEDTGVYFSFHFDDEGIRDDEAPEALRAPHAEFNLNYSARTCSVLRLSPKWLHSWQLSNATFTIRRRRVWPTVRTLLSFS